jgi:hypothetical protein
MNFRQLLNGQPTPYADLNVVLCDLVTRVRNVLGDNFIGAYLQGSFAVGDFDIYSDVDFLILLNQDIPDDQLPTLRPCTRISSNETVHGLNISKDLISRGRRLCGCRRRYESFCIWIMGAQNLSVLRMTILDDSLVVYWSLRERGITLLGPEPRSLVALVPADALRQEVFDTMHTWREQLLRNPDEMDNRFYQPFAVLSYCRMLHTLESGTVESKRAGAMWAKDALDSRWHQLIQGAWDARPGDPSLKVRQKADSSDLRSTWEFMEYAVELGRQRKENRKPVGPAAAGQPER